ncbi:MAG: chemotaxis protein CheW [Gammaproteobacteria bacterium]
MSETQRELFCILVPLGSGKLILPRSLIEEVRSLGVPEPVEGMPPWVLGRVRWRGNPIPLVAVEPLLGVQIPERSRRSRMVIVRTPEGTLASGVMGILAQGFPYILRVTPELLKRAVAPENENILAEIALGRERPVVPDLPALAAETARLFAA